jgi:hypothetical protein
MTETKLDLNEADILDYEVSDEALEAAASAGPFVAQAFTVAMCTGNMECPF